MRILKRIISISLAGVLMLMLASCGASPKTPVESFCKALKQFDIAAMAETVKDADKDSALGLGDELDDTLEDELFGFYKSCANDLKYEIGSIDTKEDKATVSVDFTYDDASAIMAGALSEYIGEALTAAFSGASGSDEYMKQLFVKCLNSAKEDYTIKSKTKNVVFNCEKDDGKWIISSLPEDIYSILTCETLNLFDDLEDEEPEEVAEVPEPEPEPEQHIENGFTVKDIIDIYGMTLAEAKAKYPVIAKPTESSTSGTSQGITYTAISTYTAFDKVSEKAQAVFYFAGNDKVCIYAGVQCPWSKNASDGETLLSEINSKVTKAVGSNPSYTSYSGKPNYKNLMAMNTDIEEDWMQDNGDAVLQYLQTSNKTYFFMASNETAIEFVTSL